MGGVVQRAEISVAGRRKRMNPGIVADPEIMFE
jgi:hypothetical protein